MTTRTAATDSQDPASKPDQEQQALFCRIAAFFGELNPTGTLSFSYLTEGAANTIWLIHFHDSNLSQHDSSAVLRMRKDVPSMSMTELKSQYEERITPLFTFDPTLLLPVHLLQINKNLVGELNNQLHALEDGKFRKPPRDGVYHPTFKVEPYAMIVPNLAYGAGSLVEFKPKWLVQSPSAPKDAQRCRTCALNAMRRARGVSGRGDSGFCPFDLLSSHQSILRDALRQIWHDESTLNQFVDAFKHRVQPALRQLQNLHKVYGEVGLGDFLKPDDKDFGVAMALRDCSVVLQVAASCGGASLDIVMVKLLDLDLKEANSTKLSKWAEIESELINGGWYVMEDATVKCGITLQ